MDPEQNEVESESFSNPEWSHDQASWQEQVAAALESVASYDPREYGVEKNVQEKSVYCHKSKKWVKIKEIGHIPAGTAPPDRVHMSEALLWAVGRQGVDLRPHLLYKGHFHLCDTGSQVTAWPPDPGDQVDPSIRLKAINGTKLKCFGFKKVEVKIGRKTYGFQAVKAEVDSPVIGADFFKHHKLGLEWADDDEVYIFDRLASIRRKLDIKPVPFEQASLSRLSWDSPPPSSSSRTGRQAEQLVQELAAIESIDDLFNATEPTTDQENGDFASKSLGVTPTY